MYSILGSEIASGYINPGETSVKLLEHQSGFYIIQLENENGEQKRNKLLKE